MWGAVFHQRLRLNIGLLFNVFVKLLAVISIIILSSFFISYWILVGPKMFVLSSSQFAFEYQNMID